MTDTPTGSAAPEASSGLAHVLTCERCRPHYEAIKRENEIAMRVPPAELAAALAHA